MKKGKKFPVLFFFLRGSSLPVFLLLCMFMGAHRLTAQSITLNQLNFNYDDSITTFSDWGAADLTFTGSSDLLYFNLSVDTGWVIENMPVLTLNGVGISQTQRFWFPIGPDGVEVFSVHYGFTLTSFLAGRPSLTGTASVSQDYVVIYMGSGSGSGGGGKKSDSAIKQVGGAPDEPTEINENFQNQEAGEGECVPTAISNSLQWLNTKYNLDMDPADMSISSLKAGTGWNPTTKRCPRPEWVKNKKDYINQNKNILNKVQTDYRANGSEYIKHVGEEIHKGQDIEMDILWNDLKDAHVVCVVGWAHLKNGKYLLVISHDSDQKDPGAGCKTESGLYDPGNGKWTGALAKGSNSFSFVVECPPNIIQQPGHPIVPPKPGIKQKNHSGSTYNVGQYQVENLYLSNFSATFTPPSLGNTIMMNYNCDFHFDFSADSGVTFIPCSGTTYVDEKITHTNDAGGKEFYDTEILSMNISLGSLPSGLRLRESLTNASTGMTIIEPEPSFSTYSRFFDVFTELSFNSGGTWYPDDNGTILLEIETPASVIPVFSRWGLLILGIAILTAGMVFFRRIRRSEATMA
ncbi:MAG: hypothetical protein NTX61_14010 [Bacteroidetes bacterium]|nr:hypothetical protein [Bacteroidota bacterium]